MATNISSPQQEANFLEEDDDTGSDEETENAIVLESDGQDTGTYHGSSTEHNFQPQDELETIPEEEEPQTEEKQDIAIKILWCLHQTNPKKNRSTHHGQTSYHRICL